MTALLQLFKHVIFFSLLSITVAKLNVTEEKNVYGRNLETCSSPGMALTGWTRDGHCVNEAGDAGSHHICLDFNSTTNDNFCTVTGQPDWCSSFMPCHDKQDKQCSIRYWCVCQWAYASYVRKAGACENVKDIKCDATNMRVLTAYEEQVHQDKLRGLKDTYYGDALQCLKRNCGLERDEL